MWSNPATRSQDDTSHRKVFQLEYRIKDKLNIVKVATECKKKGYDKDLFGEMAYFSLQPDRDAENKPKQVWEGRLRFSGTVQMNIGSVEFRGLENPDAEVEMELADPTMKSPGRMSFCSIMKGIK